MSEVKALFEPHSVVLVGSSKIREKIGMTSPWLFESVLHNMNKFFEGKTVIVKVFLKKNRPLKVESKLRVPFLK